MNYSALETVLDNLPDWTYTTFFTTEDGREVNLGEEAAKEFIQLNDELHTYRFRFGAYTVNELKEILNITSSKELE